MTGNPITTTYAVRIDTNIPTTIGVCPVCFNVADILNGGKALNIPGIPDGLMGTALWTAVLTLDIGTVLRARGATNVLFYGCQWKDHNGKASLYCTLAIQADPISVADITAIILGSVLLITAVTIVLGGALTPLGTAIVVVLLVTGGILIVAVAIDIMGSSGGNIAISFGLLIAAIAGLILIPPAVGALRGSSKPTRTKRRRTKRS